MGELLAEVAELLALEADCIDRRRWTDWIDLYTPDSLFWVPTWRNEDETIEDPEQEICLLYLPNRGIEDRVFRFTSGDAYSSTPLPTTSHVVGSVRLLSEDDPDNPDVAAKAVVATMSPRTGTQLRPVWYDYRLRRTDGGLKIATKKVTLLEQVIDGTVDVYNV
jgi:3-phenylpropionate/cinnamic acid dioxygenase small subunit